MFPWLILAAALILGGYLVARWWVQATPQQLLKGIRWTAAVIGIILLAAITLSGRWNWIPALLFFVIPWLSRLRAISSMRKNAQGPSSGQTSEVATRLLRMVLDHDSGETFLDFFKVSFGNSKRMEFCAADFWLQSGRGLQVYEEITLYKSWQNVTFDWAPDIEALEFDLFYRFLSWPMNVKDESRRNEWASIDGHSSEHGFSYVYYATL